MSYFLFADSVQRSERPEEPPHRDEPAPFVVRPIVRRAAPVPAAGAEESSPACRSARVLAKIKKPRPRKNQVQPHAPSRDSGSASARRTSSVDTGSDEGFYAVASMDGENIASVLMSMDASDDTCGDDLHGSARFGNDDKTSPDQSRSQSDKKYGSPDVNDAVWCSAAGAPTDLASWADTLTPSAGDDGIFELLLPNGETMGVVVHTQPALVSFLLSLPSETSSKLLRPQQMELERHLERRIQRNVKITFL